MTDFFNKIQQYLDFLKGPTYLLFMSEAGRCEYLIFVAVHLAIVRALAMDKDLELEEVSPYIEELAECYYNYFHKNQISLQEKCRQENKILLRYLQNTLQLKEINPEKFRQWKKRALDKNPEQELSKIMQQIKREPFDG